MTGRINEIFESIQGEGIYFGERQVFVRFSGCNLKCNYCDTDFESYREYQPRELLSEIKGFGEGFHSISFTGGEPLLQKDFLKESLRLVKTSGYTTYLETNGTLANELQEVIGDVDIVAMDIKLPSTTGLEQGSWQEHRDFLKIARLKEVFIKIVVTDSADRGEFTTALNLLKETAYSGTVVLQPDSSAQGEGLEEKLASFKELCEKDFIPVRVIPQMHKIMGVR